MPGSRVRFPPFPPTFSGTCEAPCARTFTIAGVLREPSSQTFSDAAIRLLISAGE